MPSTIVNFYKQSTLISDEVQELISYRPHWVIRKGNLIFFLIISLFIVFSWFIKYPDVIKGSMKLVAINAPKLLVARTEGKLEKLLVTNEQQVKLGQPLAFMQSTANHGQVLDLLSWIKGIEPFIDKDSLEIVLSNQIRSLSELGEIQSSYQDFQSILNETLQVLNKGYYQQKKMALQKDLYYLSAIQLSTEKQQQLIKQDYELQEIQYKANESLAKDRVIAPLELNQSKSKVISEEKNIEQVSAQIINNSIAKQSKKKEILELQKYVSDQQQKFRYALFVLKSKIEEWAEQHVVIAPESGKVLFASFLQDNQLLANGKELFYIEPPQSQYYGEMMTPQTGVGKIKTGQKVLIRVEGYPSNEFGYLLGTVNYISNMPTVTDSFLLKIDLPNGLQTNYSKTIYFRNNLRAQGEVITDNRKLFERFLGQLRDLTRR